MDPGHPDKSGFSERSLWRDDTRFPYLDLVKFIINLTITSLSCGLLSATSKVKADKAESLIFRSPVFVLNKALFCTKYSINTNEPILLLPSAKGWSLTKKYNRCAAFSSKDGYKALPPKVWSILPKTALNFSPLPGQTNLRLLFCAQPLFKHGDALLQIHNQYRRSVIAYTFQTQLTFIIFI